MAIKAKGRLSKSLRNEVLTELNGRTELKEGG
jgi:hypothetical protein